jgi:hypothetical protein
MRLPRAFSMISFTWPEACLLPSVSEAQRRRRISSHRRLTWRLGGAARQVDLT